jgi:glutathione S-transferase
MATRTGADPRTLLKVQFDRRSNHATLQNSQRDFRFQRDGSLITRGCSMSTLRTGNNSPFGRKARIDAADPIRQQNPLGKVPVLLLDDGAALYDSPVILEYLDHLAGGGRIIPADPPARFAALRLQALADGIMDASILINYEARYRPVQNHEPKWLDLQAGKVTRALAVLEAAPPGIDTPPNVGQITLACALGYRDFRFPGSWRGAHPRLAAWLDDFAARVPAFAATTPPG